MRSHKVLPVVVAGLLLNLVIGCMMWVAIVMAAHHPWQDWLAIMFGQMLGAIQVPLLKGIWKRNDA